MFSLTAHRKKPISARQITFSRRKIACSFVFLS